MRNRGREGNQKVGIQPLKREEVGGRFPWWRRKGGGGGGRSEMEGGDDEEGEVLERGGVAAHRT